MVTAKRTPEPSRSRKRKTTESGSLGLDGVSTNVRPARIPGRAARCRFAVRGIGREKPGPAFRLTAAGQSPPAADSYEKLILDFAGLVKRFSSVSCSS